MAEKQPMQVSVTEVAHGAIDTVQGLKDMLLALGLTGVVGLDAAFDAVIDKLQEVAGGQGDGK